MLVPGKGVTPAGRQVGVEAVDGKVHLRHPPGALIELLPVHRNVRALPVVMLQELLRLHKHAAGTAARVIHPATIGFQHLHQNAHHAGGGVELTTALALGLGKLLQEILVHLAQQVAGFAGALPGKPRRIKQIQQFAQPALIHVVPVVDAGEGGGQARVVRHD